MLRSVLSSRSPCDDDAASIESGASALSLDRALLHQLGTKDAQCGEARRRWRSRLRRFVEMITPVD